MKSPVTLSFEQMCNLESLRININKASVSLFKDPTQNSEQLTPVFTLQDILDILPSSIQWKSPNEYYCGISNHYSFSISKIENTWNIGYKSYGYNGVEEVLPYKEEFYITDEGEEEKDVDYFGGISEETLLEATYKMLCWLAKNELLDNKNK